MIMERPKKSLQRLVRRWVEGEPDVGHIEFSQKSSSNMNSYYSFRNQTQDTSSSSVVKPAFCQPAGLWSLQLKALEGIGEEVRNWVTEEINYWLRSPSSMRHARVTSHAITSRLILLFLQVRLIGFAQHNSTGIMEKPRCVELDLGSL